MHSLSPQTLADAIPAPLFCKDAKGRYLGCNRAFTLLLGLSREQILDRTAQEFATPDVAEALSRQDQALLCNPGVQIYETLLRNEDGKPRTVIINEATFPDGTGAVGGLAGVIQDITHCRSAEAAQLQSEAKYRTLTEKMGEGLISTDEGGRFTYCNPKFLQMTGYREEEVLGSTFFDLTYNYRYDSFHERLQNRSLGQSEQYEIQLRHQKGTPVDVLVSAEPLFDPQGQFTGTLGILTDIRERKHREEVLRREYKVESLTMLAGGIAHDFNNLFQTIQGNLEMAKELLVDPERAKRALERALQSLDKANILSQKMLDYSGKGSSQTLRVDVGELVRMHSTLFSTLTGPGTKLEYRIPARLSPIEGDPEQLLQVLASLVTNAEESFRAGKGSIRIAVEEGGKELSSQDPWVEPPPSGPVVLLTVSDTGCGMAPEAMGRLFDPFFTTKEHGRGLGLASTLGILKAHRAGLQFHSSPGEGSSFRIAFPVQTTVAVPALPHSTSATAALRKGFVLLVDDDPGVRSTGAEILKDFLGCQVLTARDGREAVKVFQQNSDAISVILMDATMPNMTGSEAYEAIKTLHPGARAILCSGYSDEIGNKLVKECGFAGFLKKPYSIKELQDAMEQATQG